MYLPIIDFSKLELSSIETDEWGFIRTLVMKAIENYGSFEVKYDKVTPELQDAVFGKAMKELFSLPIESKVKNISNKPYHGYIGDPDKAYESLSIDNAARTEDVDEFARIMWGAEGNLSFCDTIYAFTKHLAEIEQIVRRMVLESMGMEKYFDEYVDSSICALRLSQYGIQKNTEETSNLAMRSHTDVTILSIVCQHGIEGLQVQIKDGSWLIPSPYSMTVLIGQALWAWTNGRIKPSRHQVLKTNADIIRYSAIFASRPKDGYMIKSPEELIDEKHPQQFNPYEYGDYIRFCFSEVGFRTNDTLKAFCGATRENEGEEGYVS